MGVAPCRFCGTFDLDGSDNTGRATCGFCVELLRVGGQGLDLGPELHGHLDRMRERARAQDAAWERRLEEFGGLVERLRALKAEVKANEAVIRAEIAFARKVRRAMDRVSPGTSQQIRSALDAVLEILACHGTHGTFFNAAAREVRMNLGTSLATSQWCLKELQAQGWACRVSRDRRKIAATNAGRARVRRLHHGAVRRRIEALPEVLA